MNSLQLPTDFVNKDNVKKLCFFCGESLFGTKWYYYSIIEFKKDGVTITQRIDADSFNELFSLTQTFINNLK